MTKFGEPVEGGALSHLVLSVKNGLVPAINGTIPPLHIKFGETSALKKHGSQTGPRKARMLPFEKGCTKNNHCVQQFATEEKRLKLLAVSQMERTLMNMTNIVGSRHVPNLNTPIA